MLWTGNDTLVLRTGEMTPLSYAKPDRNTEPDRNTLRLAHPWAAPHLEQPESEARYAAGKSAGQREGSTGHPSEDLSDFGAPDWAAFEPILPGQRG